ncbi:MAG TPA: division/cell wall cluster transcriptional repressor MraZ [Cyclobacteriaceae bacterium]|nr:division/cell wall cluster transcriptional repressor MraZ [Cyclobacteriaceae bacterium]
MRRFTSNYVCKLDAKGRLVLPARLKAAIPENNGATLMLMHYFEPCLAIYTLEEFDITADKIAGLNEMKKEDRNIQRNFFRRVVEVELDSAGRILIPKNMLEAVKIDKEVMAVGAGNRVELWNPGVYQANYDMEDEELTDQVQDIS